MKIPASIAVPSRFMIVKVKSVGQIPDISVELTLLSKKVWTLTVASITYVYGLEDSVLAFIDKVAREHGS